MVRPGEHVLVAVSGGADSIGLLALLCQLRRGLGLELVAGHVNHRLRGAESDADERCAALAAEQLGVPFARCALGRGLGRGGNLEERARELRYQALQRLAAQHGCSKVATGHTQDDQAETVLMRLIRGSGPVGLGAIQPCRADGVIRPLIDCRRADVERAVRALDLEYRVDRSNVDPRFLRTHVRSRVLPLLAELNPAIVRGLAQTAALQRGEAEILAQWAARWAAELGNSTRFDAAGLASVPAAGRGYVLRHWLVAAGVAARGLSARHIEAVEHLASGARRSGAVAVPGGGRVRRVGSHLMIGDGPPRPSFRPRRLAPGRTLQLPGGWSIAVSAAARAGRGTARLPPDCWSAVCDVDAAGKTGLAVRVPLRGERIRPLGLGGSRKLSDVFIDAKVPLDERATYPVVACGGVVVWVPGLVRSTVATVSAATKRVIRLRATRGARDPLTG